jgi:hypothetical protein
MTEQHEWPSVEDAPTFVTIIFFAREAPDLGDDVVGAAGPDAS